jgi:hypothetical protein
MAFVSGLVSQLGWGVESTAGTAVTVNKFQPHLSESIKKDLARAQGEGLYGSTNGGPLLSRHITTTETVSGDFEIDVTDKGLGTLWRWATGSTTTPAVLTGAAYEAVFAPGDQMSAGCSCTFQVGRPQITSGTVRAFTWKGCKCSSFEVSGTATDPLTAKFSLDGWTEVTATALATASYSTTQTQFTGANLTVNIGGTPSTSSGKTSIASGTALTGVKGVSIKVDNPLATDRFYANGAGVKAEQVVNGYRSVEIELDMDFIERTTLYDLYAANTTTALQVIWALPTAITGSHYPTVEFTFAACKITAAEVNVDGTDIVPQKVTLTALYNGTDNYYQVRTISTDTTL